MTLEEAKAHTFFTAGIWSGKTVAEALRSAEGRNYLRWWLVNQPKETQTYRAVELAIVDLDGHAPPTQP